MSLPKYYVKDLKSWDHLCSSGIRHWAPILRRRSQVPRGQPFSALDIMLACCPERRQADNEG